MNGVEERQDEENQTATDECVACREPVAIGEAESTFCGTVHESCLEDHKQGCAVCNEDNQ